LFVGRFDLNALDKWHCAASLRISAAYLDERDGMPDKVFVERKQMVAVNGNFAIGENEPQRLGWNELHHIQA
jgi:hypothetical protein